jgi:hypothetical protein
MTHSLDVANIGDVNIILQAGREQIRALLDGDFAFIDDKCGHFSNGGPLTC